MELQDLSEHHAKKLNEAADIIRVKEKKRIMIYFREKESGKFDGLIEINEGTDKDYFLLGRLFQNKIFPDLP